MIGEEQIEFDALLDNLTWREHEVLGLLSKRLTNREIASQLNIVESTVKEHVGNILSKLHVKNRRQAVERAKVLGYFTRDGPHTTRISNNLPTPATSFVGREKELASLDQMLEEPAIRLVTLLGPPGSGKTRLALKSAANQLRKFNDRVYFVPLAPIRDPELVPSTIATALSLKPTGGQPLEQILHSYLRGRETLLLLDNFEHVLSATTLISRLLTAAGGLKILATSRETLHISGEHEFTVSPLELPQPTEELSLLKQRDSVALFTTRAQAVMPAFQLTEENAPLVAGICHRLDGLPLAIELAAAQVKLLGLKPLSQRLENRMQTLVDGPIDIAKRQQTLQGAIEWSYDLLDEDEKLLFARLGVFSGSSTPEAVEVICRRGLSTNISELLKALLRKSMLGYERAETGESRFSMLETLREYALKQLEHIDELESMRKSHAEYFLSLAEKSDTELRGPDQSSWLDKLDPDHDNLRAALRWGMELGDREFCLRLTAALGMYWYGRSHFKEGVHRTAEAIALAGDASSEILGRALISGSNLSFYLGDQLEEGKVWAERALTIFSRSNDKANLAWAHFCVGMQFAADGDFDQFEIHTKLAHQLFLEVNDKQGLATIFTSLGEIARLRDSDFQAAEKWYQESLTLSRELDHRYYICCNLYNLSDVAIQQLDFKRHGELIEECLTLAWKNNIWDMCGYALYGLANALVRNEELEQAARLMGAYKAFLDHLGVPAQPHEATNIEAGIASVRDLLGEEVFEGAFAEGRRMDEARAIRYALSLGAK